MADEWHVDWLREGVKKWNKRRKKVSFKPDLSGLRFFDMLPPDFRDAPKTSRYFEKIDLTNANLAGSDLSHLNFRGARFDGANLSGSDMSLSNFSSASFKRTEFRDVNLENSLFTDAKFEAVEFAEATAV